MQRGVREALRQAQMALACGGIGTAIGGLVSPAHATPKRSGHPRSTCMLTSCPLVAVSKQVRAEELSRKGERRCIASRRLATNVSLPGVRTLFVTSFLPNLVLIALI